MRPIDDPLPAPKRLVALGLAGCLAAAGGAAAQTVQKCIAGDGAVTFTSDACAGGERLAARYDAVPEPASAPAATPSSPAAGAERPRARTPARRQAAPSRARRGPDPCAKAREARERTLRRVGLKRTFDLLRRLDDEVWAACR